MGDWDCFCALCAGPLSITHIELGDKRAKALKKRLKHVQKAKRKRAKEAGEEYGSDENKDESESEDEDGNEDGKLDKNTEQSTIEPPNREEDDDDNSADGDYQAPSESATSISSENSRPSSSQGDGSDLHSGPIEDVPTPYRRRDSDTWSQASELSTSEGWDGYHGKTEEDEMYRWEEESSFDPSLLTVADMRWIHRCRVICLNPDAPGVSKAYFSGRGVGYCWGSFEPKKPSTDPNYPDPEPAFTCYYAVDDPYAAFPFHEACFKILAKCLGSDDPRLVNKDKIYDIMDRMTDEYGRTLPLNYGPVSYKEQYWSTEPGEEFSVCDPCPKPGLETALQSMLPSSLFEDTTASVMDLEHKVQNDLFKLLPYDIVHIICDYLTREDTFALIEASWHILMTTRNNSFWEHVMRTRMPWFWELPDLLEKTIFPPSFNYKGLFLWLDYLTTPRFGMRGPASILGVANRRRIWNTCQELLDSYDVEYAANDDEAGSEQAKEILDSAISSHVPVVLHPYPVDVVKATALFVRSWDEIYNLPAEFSTHWNASGSLVGVSVRFNTDVRVFGDMNGTDMISTHVRAREWITELQLTISDVQALEGGRFEIQDNGCSDMIGLNCAGITELTIDTDAGYRQAANSTREGSYRILKVHPDMCLVGLTGTIAPNGVISSLGLLQAPRPPKTSQSSSINLSGYYKIEHSILWNQAATYMLSTSAYQQGGSILSHSLYSLYTFLSSAISPEEEEKTTTSIDPLTPHADMIPHDIFIWTDWPYRYRPLTRLSARVVRSRVNREGETPVFSTDITGIRAMKKFKEDHGTAKYFWCEANGEHTGGSGENEEDEGEAEDADADAPATVTEPGTELSHFDIAGANGEAVTEVHWNPILGALKLVTNHGRECTWGESDGSSTTAWSIKRSDPGEIIVGLRCCYGRLGGWDEAAGTYRHWKLTDVGVVVAKMEEASLEVRERWRW